MVINNQSAAAISPFWKLVIAVGFCEAAGLLSAKLSRGEFSFWLTRLNKPEWNPPKNLFETIWTLLYFIIGVALWHVWKSKAPGRLKIRAEMLFILQLFFSFWWSILFFKMHDTFLAFIDTIVIFLLIVFTMMAFNPVSKKAVFFLIPYLLGVCFALTLNYTIWTMN